MMSVPSTTSRLRVLASSSCGKIVAGRRLANACRPARRPSRPRSGRSAAGRVSHLYPPMAARRTASDALHVSSVTSGSGTPVASSAAPPINASWMLREKPSFFACDGT